MKQVLFFALLVVCVVGSFTPPVEVNAITSYLSRSHHNARARSTCTVQDYGCASNGQFCAQNSSSNIFCTDVYDFCNTTSGVCQTNPDSLAPGAACNSSRAFHGETFCAAETRCINSMCNSAYKPGAPCMFDYHCAYSTNVGTFVSTCSNGKCAGLPEGADCTGMSSACLLPLTCGPNKTCITPLAVGSNCIADTDCVQTAGCIYGQCTALVGNGGACDNQQNRCEGSYICYPSSIGNVNGTCQVYYMGTVGSICTSNSMCAEGLLCNNTVCAQGIPFGKSSQKLCNSSSDCAFYEECSCDGSSGQTKCYVSESYIGNPTGFQKFAQGYLDCLGSCMRTDYACITSKCQTQSCNYLGAYISAIFTEGGNNMPQCAKTYSVNALYAELGSASLPGYFNCPAPGTSLYTVDNITSSANILQFSLGAFLFITLALLL